MSGSNNDPKPTHFILISSAGMGHLAPFCRIAAALSTHGCTVTFVAAQPTVSNAESLHLSNLIASYPSIRLLNLTLAPLPAAQYPPTLDPFYRRVEAIRRSAHFLPTVLNSIPDPPVSAAIVDIMLISAFVPVTKCLNLPSYVMFTSSLSMLSLFVYFPDYLALNSEVGDVEIPGVVTVKKSSLPPPLLDPTDLFRIQFIENGAMIRNTDGVLVNSFQALEHLDLSAALNLPPIYQVC
uniref:UDP-glycosyltransferase n=1 Tax=Allium cepa TaxID=4679 RepID=A0A2H5AHW2_ALLCE|nr:UDP-glycosyltransferase [Allium cepa]